VPGLLQRLNRPVVAILAVGLLAGGLRFWHLSSPDERIFDEVYYPKAGCVLVGGTNQQCDISSSDEHYWVEHKWDVGSWVHPPLGKWMIGLGEKAFGFDSFGWRVSSAAVGTLTVMLVALLAYLLFGSALWAFVAGFLLSIEGLSFVMSRTGLLDSFLTFWVVAGFTCLVLDRRWIDRRTPPESTAPTDPSPPPDARPQQVTEPSPLEAGPPPAAPDPSPRPATWVPSPVWRPWRFATGVALGAAIATKWSGALALAAAGLIALAWETGRRMRGESTRRRAFVRAFARESFGLILAFLFVPAAVYLLSYLPWFHHFGWSLSLWWDNQKEMWDYHQHLQWYQVDAATGARTPTHPWLSHAYTWISMNRPVLFFARYANGHTRWITTIGNPAVFWAAVWTIPFTAYGWWNRRDWRAGLIVTAIAVQWLPWFLVSRPQFFFYILPVAPFLVLAAVYTARGLSDMTIVQRDPITGDVTRSTHHPYRPVVWGYLFLTLAFFVWFWPVLTGGNLSDAAWHLRIWMKGWA
jgi:dolichyl-phosphate-mannose--protein O-mannosyl transferase